MDAGDPRPHPPGGGDRVFTLPLVAALVLVAVLLLKSLADRLGQDSPAAVLAALRDGDLERTERIGLLRQVLATAGRLPDRPARLAGAMAAVGLEDEGAYAALARALGSPVPVAPADAGCLEDAGLGDPVLTALLRAMLAEATGDPGAARTRYEQVMASSRLFHMELSGRLAAAGRDRVR